MRGTSFPVIYGMTDADCSELGGLCAYSDISEEIRLETKNVPPEKIKFIGVPPEKVDYVRKLVGDRQIEVGALDLPLDTRAVEHLSLLEILKRGSTLAAEHGTPRRAPNPIKEPELKELAKTRFIDRIRMAYNNLRKRITARWHERGDRTENER